MSPDDTSSTPSSSSTPAPATPAKPAAKPKPKASPAATSTNPSTSSSPSASPATTPAAAGAKPKLAPSPKPAPAKAAPAAPPKTEKPARKWERAEKPSRPAGPAPKVVDASGLVLGRAASVLAKRLLNGETIVVVNTEKAVVVGGAANVLELYRLAVARGSVRKGPHYPRRPDRIFRRTVRGMLPFRHSKGREAWSRILTYVGEPAEFHGLPRETIEKAKARPALRPPLTLGEISRRVGGIGPW